MSNFPPVPRSLRLLDKANLDEYRYISPDDKCLYIWERMSQVKAGEWDDYPANNLISNLQIPVSCKTDNPSRYKHKATAIQYAAQALSQLLKDLRDGFTCVPVPPSKVAQDAGYDARLLRVLKAIQPPLGDIRELLLLTRNHDSKQKGLSPQDRMQDYAINESQASPGPKVIVVFDDVLTTGSHFKAIKYLLQKRFPSASIYGIFLTRAVRQSTDEDISI